MLVCFFIEGWILLSNVFYFFVVVVGIVEVIELGDFDVGVGFLVFLFFVLLLLLELLLLFVVGGWVLDFFVMVGVGVFVGLVVVGSLNDFDFCFIVG